ncbi:UDP/ADP-SUGAR PYROPHOSPHATASE [Salix koriyanagi]|uniref:UDP/ADP-SUGAR PYROPHOSPHATASE n=1 Tax=Salix koriyanagi TaxID=2511006 RepID=A0A9Q1AHW7_9ROSI|nr:UDP/ADP-SUGAR PYROPHOSPHATASE [Salix koriyanagi]
MFYSAAPAYGFRSNNEFLDGRFLMRLTKDESEINLASGEADPEFAEWKWASPEEVIEQAVDYKRPTYEEVMRTFRPYLNENGIAAKCKSSKW